MAIQLNKPLVFLDLETTGIETLIDRIVEFSALKINPDNTEESITFRVNPQIPISPEAIAVHGITDEDVKEAEKMFRDLFWKRNKKFKRN